MLLLLPKSCTKWSSSACPWGSGCSRRSLVVLVPVAKITQDHHFIIEMGSCSFLGQICLVFYPFFLLHLHISYLQGYLEPDTSLAQEIRVVTQRWIPSCPCSPIEQAWMEVPGLAGALGFSFANGFISTSQVLSVTLMSFSLHHWPGRDCHHLRWHQVTRDLHQPIYDLFSSINSSLARGFPECEIFVHDDNALVSSAKPPGCQQLQGDPKPLMLVTPALCLVWLGEETAKGNFCSKNSSFHLSLPFWP